MEPLSYIPAKILLKNFTIGQMAPPRMESVRARPADERSEYAMACRIRPPSKGWTGNKLSRLRSAPNTVANNQKGEGNRM